jgi:hypothetical protein
VVAVEEGESVDIRALHGLQRRAELRGHRARVDAAVRSSRDRQSWPWHGSPILAHATGVTSGVNLERSARSPALSADVRNGIWLFSGLQRSGRSVRIPLSIRRFRVRIPGGRTLKSHRRAGQGALRSHSLRVGRVARRVRETPSPDSRDETFDARDRSRGRAGVRVELPGGPVGHFADDPGPAVWGTPCST